MGRKVAIAAGVVLALAAGSAVAWLVFLRDTSTPVSAEDAVLELRADERGAAGAPAPPVEVGLAADGVYVYTTTGFERISALGGARHAYPAETTITVRRRGCGITLRWDALAGRRQSWKVCPTRDGWRLRVFRENHRFFGKVDRRQYRCTGNSFFRPSGSEPGTTFGARCSTSDTTETAEGEVVGVERIAVGGRRVEALHLRVSTTLAGRSDGSGTRELWLLETGLPVRMRIENESRTRSPLGPVTYAEQYELRLKSLKPRR